MAGDVAAGTTGMKPHLEVLIPVLALSFAAVSVSIWVAVFRVWRRDGTVLPYVPRRRVPWGPVGLLIAGLFIVPKLLALLSEGKPAELSADDATGALLQWAAFELIVTAVGVLLLRHFSRARRDDLGLPDRLGDGVADMSLGVVAVLASLVPVYLVLNLFVVIFGPIPQHPILELLEKPSLSLMAATVLSAVVAAPIFEEFVFRLLLQGWLEKILMPSRAFVDRGAVGEQGGEERDEGPEWLVGSEDRRDVSASPPYRATSDIQAPPTAEGPETSEDVRTSWLPIVISSVLFASAHLGYGYSPVPLFLLSLILGYTYQRTHRILPCIVAHMVFNGISVGMMGLEVFGRPAVPGG